MSRRRMRGRAGAAGFTLVEVLIATALMAAILTALATVTAQWLPNWNRGFAHVQRSELLAQGLERLVADLAAAEFIPAGREGTQPAFDGSELSVSFVRTALGPNTRPGLELVRIAETADERGPLLVRMRAPFAPAGPDGWQASFADPVVLARSPYRISFAYAGADRIWRPAWRGADRLPMAIRVSVRDAATDRSLAISTATLVHADAPADCVLAEVIADCLDRRRAQPAADPVRPQ